MPDRVRALEQLRSGLVTVVAFAAVGAVAGGIWVWAWSPPSGVVLEDRWVLDSTGLAEDFSGTAWYVVIAMLAGLVTAVVVGWATRRHELAVLLGVAVGSVLAGWLMFHVGHALGPTDPQVLAQGKDDLTALPGDLTVAGVGGRPSLLRLDSSAFVAFPAGALVGLCALFLTTDRRPVG